MRQYTRVQPAIRFWSKVAITANPDKCWLWDGAKDSRGYGRFNLGGHNGKTLLAHRFSWELTNGELSPDLDVCHHCDNPNCVNPSHLFLGTHKDNMNDRDKKGRFPHKLTADDVQAIRDRYAVGDIFQKDLGRLFGISQTQVWAIVRYRNWNRDENGSKYIPEL